MSRLVFVRHGESQVFVDRIVGGLIACNGLSDLGRRQASALRERLPITHELDPVDLLVASTMPRARETAEIIAPSLGGLAVREDEAFCERHPGEADGMSYDDAIAKYGYDDFEDDPSVALSPGGETWIDFHERVTTAVNARRRRAPGPHGRDRLPCGRDRRGDQRVARPPDGRWLRALHPEHRAQRARARPRTRPRSERWRLLRYNDAAHLAGVG